MASANSDTHDEAVKPGDGSDEEVSATSRFQGGVAVVTAVLTVVGAILGARIGAHTAATEARALDSDQYVREAYTTYLGHVTEMQELLWSNVWWLDLADLDGDGEVSEADELLRATHRNKFWDTVPDLHRDLQVSEETLRLVLPSESLDSFHALTETRRNLYSDYRCKAQLVATCDPERPVPDGTFEDFMVVGDTKLGEVTGELRESVRRTLRVETD